MFNLNSWSIVLIIVFTIFLVPIGFIFSSLFSGFSENFYHIYEYVLIEYSINSIILLLGTISIAVFFGVGTAYLVSNYKFFGKGFFEWGLLLPLAVPPYILAYVFTGIFDSYGSANNLIRDVFGLPNEYIFFPNLRNLTGAIIVFGFTLYPYVYLVSRVAFKNISGSLNDAARVLGQTRFNAFFKVQLPLIRPAIFAGIALVAMETLSDFGAVEHFAIPTFTTGIFRTWFGLYDLDTAMQLASILLLFIFIFIYFERSSRSKIRYSNKSDTLNPRKEHILDFSKGIACSIFCVVPVVIGFFLPVAELSSWLFQQNFEIDSKYLGSVSNTLMVSFAAAFIGCFLALITNFSARINKSKTQSNINIFLSLGYGIPGLILAVGITKFFTTFDNVLLADFELFITGSIFGLIMAYVIKSYALPNNLISSGYNKFSVAMDESAEILGAPKRKILQKIHAPLLRPSIFAASLLVVAEIVKELPATLVLRPFNFDTLAVSAYIFASEERMFEAAPSALSIVLIGLIPIFFLNKMIRESKEL